MAKNLEIKIELLDYWTKDTYTYKGYKIYLLLKIGNKIKLVEKWLNEIDE